MGVELDRYTFSKSQPIIPFFINTSASGSTSSSSPVDYPGPVEKIITKRHAATSLLVSGRLGAFKGTNAGIVEFYLRISSTDYFLTSFFFNSTAVHHAVPFTVPIAQTLRAGVFTARLRWATATASANVDGNDLVQIKIEEGYWL